MSTHLFFLSRAPFFDYVLDLVSIVPSLSIIMYSDSKQAMMTWLGFSLASYLELCEVSEVFCRHGILFIASSDSSVSTAFEQPLASRGEWHMVRGKFEIRTDSSKKKKRKTKKRRLHYIGP